MNVFICYPKCSTCKRAEAFLVSHQISFEKRNIKEDNPGFEEIKTLIKRSRQPVKSFFNTSGILYRELGLKDKLPAMSDEEKARVLASDGMLVKRPIFITDDIVLVGFKEQQWSKLIK